MSPHLEFLLPCLYDDASLHPEHLTDLRKYSLTDETIGVHKIRSVPAAHDRPVA
jgi:hypothetical protein